MKPFRVPRWYVQGVNRWILRPLRLLIERINVHHVECNVLELQPGRFVCAMCLQKKFGVWRLKFDNGTDAIGEIKASRVCRKCYDEVPF